MTREQLIETMARAMAAGDSAEIGTVLFDEIHWPEFGPGYTESAKNALTAIEAAGLAIVPVEATPEMVHAALTQDAKGIWPAMIEAGRI